MVARRGEEAGIGAALAASPYFKSLPERDLAFLAERTRRESHAAGAVLFMQDEACPGLYIVEAGLVRIYRLSAEGREQVLRVMRPGESFNEAPVFDRGPNLASAEAVVASTVLVVSADAVRALLRSNPSLAEAVLAIFANRLRHLVVLVEDLSFRHVAARLAKVLLQAAEPSAGVGAGLERELGMTQQDLAALAGTAREVVARTLKEFTRVGAVRLERGHIRILDRGMLERFAA